MQRHTFFGDVFCPQTVLCFHRMKYDNDWNETADCVFYQITIAFNPASSYQHVEMLDFMYTWFYERVFLAPMR